jgi:hypothetical protein
LGKASEAIPALQPLQQKSLNLSTDLKARPRYVQDTVKAVDFLAKVLPWAIAAGFLWAIALARQKLRVVSASLIVIAIFMLLELIGLKTGQQAVIDQVRVASNVPAVTYIYETVTAGLRSNILWVLGLAVLGGILCLLAAPFAWTRQLRSVIHLDRLSKTTAATWLKTARLWVGHFEYYIWLTLLLIVLIIGAFATNTLTLAAVLRATMIVFSLWAIIHIFAKPVTAATK